MYAVSNRYKEVIYSQDCRHKLRIWFNGVELEDADIYCEKLTVSSNILPTGGKRFSLDNLVSKEATLILHDVPLDRIVDQVELSLGTLVDGEYEYVPLGVFNIQDKPTTDKNKTTVKLRDNSVKLDYNYNAKPVIDENGGSATKLQIFQDICSQFGISTKVASFLNSNEEIGIYDNTIKARTYITYFAEQSGAIATFDRDGDLIFVYLSDLVTQTLPLHFVEKYEDGDNYKISRVVYEDAVRKYETGEDTNDTLFLNSANPYISSIEQVEAIAEKVIGFEISSYKTGKIIGNPAIDSYDLISITDGDKTFVTLANNKMVYNGVIISTYDTKIGLEARKENVSATGEAQFRKWAKTEINNLDASIKLSAGEIDANSKKLASIEIEVGKVTTTVSETNKKVDELGDSIEYFSVDLSQYSLIIPTGSDKKPLETKNYDVPFYAYYKGKQVTPNLTLSGSNVGITASKTNTYVRFAVNSNNAIVNMLNQYTLTFSYTADGNTYTSTKKVDISLALQGKDGIGEDGNGISNITRYYLATDVAGGSEVIEWDGDTTDRENYQYFYKVSDKVFTEEEIETKLMGAEVEITAEGETTTMTIDGYLGPPASGNRYVLLANESLNLVTIYLEGHPEVSPGTYFLHMEGFISVNKLTIGGGGISTDTEGWTTEIQTIDSTNKYLWSYEVVTFDDGTTNTSEPVIIGVYGDKGIDGINGESAYIHIRYSANENGSSMTTAPTSDTEYMGVANTTSPTAPTSPSGYKWTKIKGEQGKDGEDGIGIDGEDGKTSYLHIKYSEDGVSFTPADEIYALGERPSAWIGQYVDYTEADSDVFSDYDWYKFTENIDPTINDINNNINDMNNDIADNLSNINKVEKRTSKLEETVDGLTNTLTTSGGGNLIKDSLGTLNDGSWVGNVSSIRDSNTLSYSIAGVGIMLNSGIIEQTIQLPNAIHTISFNYKKTLSTVNAKLYINETIYDLSSVETILFEQQINIANNSLTIKFESDTDNGCYILDLMLNLGSAKQVWSQNANETSTDTVKIGKGIQVESSKMNTYFRADADGTRVFNRTTNEVVREDTDKGTKTKQLISKDTSIINGVLFTRVGNQVWESVV